MISVEDWAEIRRLHRAEKMPVRAIARKLGISRNTVRRAVASDAPPKYQRAPKGSIVDAVELQIRELVEQWPDMPATVIAERIGWTRSLTVVTSNKPFGRWGEVFGDDTVAAAMIDRLVHHAEVISLRGDSFRMRGRDLGSVPPAETSKD
ncbi:ATP-binding protein [Streptomyces klenkii]|uniref:ATP-binding protein n=1 Tax=Streptomyces klenkii TaxID=1420899 RepID=UPI0034477B74